MSSYEHTKLVERIAALSKPPQDEVNSWLEARAHLGLLDDNSKEEELIVWSSDGASIVHGVILPAAEIESLDMDEFLRAGVNAITPRAGFDWNERTNEIWIEETDDTRALIRQAKTQRLVFGRTLRGFGDEDETHFEVLQEYIHTFDAYWRPNERAYCCFDKNGDIVPVVSVTLSKSAGTVDLISFRRQQLDAYLVATKSVLIRFFDFTLIPDMRSFKGWPDGLDTVTRNGDTFFSRQKIESGQASYTYGIQVIRPIRTKSEIVAEFETGRARGPFVEFLAHDWRTHRVTEISTDPSATTNYFRATENQLPFEVSPAFFRPEVLLRYKGNRAKYTMREGHRSITCRGGWELRSYDINDAGQVSAYIVDLRSLPHAEQIYWKSFNESPRAPISNQAFRRDFRGEWTDPYPCTELLAMLQEWDYSKVSWWKLRNRNLINSVNVPYAESRDEWAQAFENLAKLVVEGLEKTAIRTRLGELMIPFSGDDRTIALLEKLLLGEQAVAKGERLSGLREAQQVRTMVAAHTFGQEAHELESQAKLQHGSFAAHFQSVCKTIIGELEHIENAFAAK